MKAYRSIDWRDGVVRMLDQRCLPHETVYLDYSECCEVAIGIKEMVIRGAPAIGAAAAYASALEANHSAAEETAELLIELEEAADILRAARPTARNLFWAIDRVMNRISDPLLSTPAEIRAAVLTEAHAIAENDIHTNKQIGLNALPIIPDTANIIHHCNTGSLATVDFGTALGIIRTAHEHGKKIHVYVDETRPRLQGARLTTWEFKQLGIPHTVIVDSASGHFMRTVGIDLCVVGCDRVAANGDTANKIGTYNLALIASAHGVPFYVAAPTSTIDLSVIRGDEIKIEERPEREITHIEDYQITPDNVSVANPAFDMTPARYITAFITEEGIVYPPYEENLTELIEDIEVKH